MRFQNNKQSSTSYQPHKSGDLTKTDNYQGIRLISIVAMLYNQIILNRICPVLLQTNQKGYHEGRTTISQVLALQHIIEAMKKKKLDYNDNIYKLQ